MELLTQYKTYFKMETIKKNRYLIALPSSKNSKGFCHPTILVLATDENDAIDMVKNLKPHCNIGDIRKVDY
jgi:hypothetical protein